MISVLIDTNILISAALSNKGAPYQAYMKAGEDILLTGDKDFLEANIEKPKIITAAEFLKL